MFLSIAVRRPGFSNAALEYGFVSEQMVKWLIVAGAVMLPVVWRLLARSAEERRRRHFAALAARFGAEVDVDGHTLRFTAVVDERDFEVRDGYRGGGLGAETTARRYFTVSTPLRGRSWDLHDVKVTVRRKSASAFADRFRVEQFGMALPDHWLTDDVRGAIFTLSAHANPEILIEAGNLVFRTMASAREFSPDRLGECLAKQASLAGAVESARR